MTQGGGTNSVWGPRRIAFCTLAPRLYIKDISWYLTSQGFTCTALKMTKFWKHQLSLGSATRRIALSTLTLLRGIRHHNWECASFMRWPTHKPPLPKGGGLTYSQGCHPDHGRTLPDHKQFSVPSWMSVGPWADHGFKVREGPKLCSLLLLPVVFAERVTNTL